MSEREVVINACYGGFSLSPKGVEAYLARKGKKVWWFTDARDAQGHISWDLPKVPCDPEADGVFLAYSYTIPNPEPRNDEGYFSSRDIPRDDPDLVAVVKEFGRDANGRHASLEVVAIPADVEWTIEEYDGLEHVAEAHRTWS